MKALYVSLLLGAVLLALGLSQTGGPSPGVDGFGRTWTIEGTIQEQPYGLLHVREGGEARAYFLMGTAKSDAAEQIRGLDRQAVRMEATRIQRSNVAALEVHAVERTPGPPILPPEAVVEERVTLRGEIVDTKCALGRMKPGDGVAHRECAIRCIRGGIPPTLMVPHGSDAFFYLLVGPELERLNDAVLPFVGDPVEVQGTQMRQGSLLMLRVDVSDIRPLN